MKKKFISLILASVMVLSSTCASLAAEQIDLQDDAVTTYMEMIDSFKQFRNGVEEYPDYYAGAYLDANNELVVLVKETEMNQRNIAPAGAKVKSARYSLNELINIKNQIDEYWEKNENSEIAGNISGFGIIEDENKVLISLKSFSDENKKAVLDALNVDSEMLKFEQRGKIQNTSANLGSGIYYYVSSTSASYRSIGFRCQMSSNGTVYNGFVTAAHNLGGNSIIYDTNDNRVGQVKGYSYGGTTDAAFVYADSQSVPSTTEAGYSIVGNHYVTGFLTGSTTVMEGYSSNRKSGKIISNSYSAEDDTGTKFRDLVLTEHSSLRGDSGGIIYMTVNGDRVPAGIVKGELDSNTVFCKVQNIVTNLGVIPY